LWWTHENSARARNAPGAESLSVIQIVLRWTMIDGELALPRIG